jgi:hypothetical protein
MRFVILSNLGIGFDDAWAAAIALLALLLLVRYQVETWRPVPSGAAVDLVHYLLG